MIGFLLCPLWYWQPFHISKCRGAEGTCKALPNEALCKHPRKHGLITRAYLRQTSLNCWFLFLFTAAPCFHSHSFEFCCFGTFATSTRTSRSTDFGTSFKASFSAFGVWSMGSGVWKTACCLFLGVGLLGFCGAQSSHKLLRVRYFDMTSHQSLCSIYMSLEPCMICSLDVTSRIYVLHFLLAN